MAEFAEAYLVQAWPFAVLHLFLALLVFVLLVAFLFWKPGRGELALAELESRSQHLRGVIGLFLLVGIAGTFYALWGAKDKLRISEDRPAIVVPGEPAGAAPSPGLPRTPSRAAPSKIAAVLAPAFPVGLVGLALTFGFSLTLDFLEHFKRAQVIKASEKSPSATEALVNRALEKLAVLLQGERAQTRAELQLGFERLEGALRPITDLQQALSASLEPVVRELARSLEGSTELLREQGQRLESSAATLVSAAGELTTSARDIRQAVANLSGITASALESHAAAQKLEAEATTTLDAARTALSTLVDRTEDLHTQLTEDLRATGAGIGEVVDRLRETPGLLVATLEHQGAALRHETTLQIDESLRQAREGFARAAHDFASAVAANRATIEEIAARVVQAEAQHVALQRAVADEATRSVSELSQAFQGTIAARTQEALGPLEMVSQASLGARERLGEAEHRLGTAFAQYEAGMTQQTEVLARGAQVLTRSTQSVSQALDTLASVVGVRATGLESSARVARGTEPRSGRPWSWARRLWPFGRGRSSRH